MRVAVIAASPVCAAHIMEAFAGDSRFKPARMRHDRGLIAFDVAIVEGFDAGDLAIEGPPVILIDGDDELRDALNSRIRASLPPDFLPGELLAAAEAAAHDFTVLTSAQVRRWLVRREARDRDIPTETLTVRELEVLRMLAYGLGNKEIGSQLGISDHTAKFHVAQILAKFHAGSRAEAVAIGIRRGLVPI